MNNKKLWSVFLVLSLTVVNSYMGETCQVVKAENIEATNIESPYYNEQSDEGIWSYVSYGEYPQSEIEESEITSEIVGAAYDEHGDAVINDEKVRRAFSLEYKNGKAVKTKKYKYYRYAPIIWRVIKNNDGILTLMSDKILDCKRYDSTEYPESWEKSELCAWLNGKNIRDNESETNINNNFINTAFSSSERMNLIQAENGDFVSCPTAEQICLNENGFKESWVSYSLGDSSFSSTRKIKGSAYSLNEGLLTEDDSNDLNVGMWWIKDICYVFRSGYYIYTTPGFVSYYGEVLASEGEDANSECIGIVPVINVSEEYVNAVKDNIDIKLNYTIKRSESNISGMIGDNISWKFEDGILTFSGKGDMGEYLNIWTYNHSPWYGNDIRKVVFEEGITSIGDYVCCNISTIEQISLPESIKEIGKSAFYGCSNLKNIQLPSKLEIISDLAFKLCGFSELDIPKNVTFIGREAFDYNSNLLKVRMYTNALNDEWGDLIFNECENLALVELMEGSTGIPEGMFDTCRSLSEIKIPSTVKKIGAGAFKETSLDKIDVSSAVILGMGCFAECNNLNEIKLSSELQIIEERTFYCCGSLKNIDIPNDVIRIGEKAFYGSNLTYVKLPDKLRQIEAYAFDDTHIESVVIPGSVGRIGTGAFMKCDELKKIILEEGIKVIGAYAFGRVGDMENVIIPQSVSVIERGAFSKDKINSIYINSKKIHISISTFDNTLGVIFGEKDSYLQEYVKLIKQDRESKIEFSRLDQLVVKFEPFGGKMNNEMILLDNEISIEDLEVPVLDGYQFMGWYTDIERTQLPDLSKKGTSITLYGKWKQNERVNTPKPVIPSSPGGISVKISSSPQNRWTSTPSPSMSPVINSSDNLKVMASVVPKEKTLENEGLLPLVKGITSKIKNKDIIITWKNIKGAQYKIVYSSKKHKILKISNYGKIRDVWIKHVKKNKIKLKNNIKNKKYYYRICAYKIEKGKIIYGKWSDMKSVRVKSTDSKKYVN